MSDFLVGLRIVFCYGLLFIWGGAFSPSVLATPFGISLQTGLGLNIEPGFSPTVQLKLGYRLPVFDGRWEILADYSLLQLSPQRQGEQMLLGSLRYYLPPTPGNFVTEPQSTEYELFAGIGAGWYQAAQSERAQAAFYVHLGTDWKPDFMQGIILSPSISVGLPYLLKPELALKFNF